MLTMDQLETRREEVAASPDLSALRDHLLTRARIVVARDPGIPPHKGMLSADGGVCPADGAALLFDPFSPSSHRCGRCGTAVRGDRHDRRWAWQQHLWLGERIAELTVTGLLADEDAAVEWAARRTVEYAQRYLRYPNVDNVLGPSRLFFSTYLESVWLTSYLGGAFLLREANALDEEAIKAVNGLVDEAVALIGEFDEGLSNRQTWHNAALAAAAVWFEDEDLARRAIEGARGLVGHLADGFGTDGMWYEGENYHLFALRGLLVGAGWARIAGVDLFEEEAGRGQLAAALRAPLISALPDGTFPARKDARYGVSLAQPMYLDSWEVGLAGLLRAGGAADAATLVRWLRHCYAQPAPPAELFDSYLHEAGEPRPERRGRSDLSWWSLGAMLPELPGPEGEPETASALLEEQGLAILRHQDRYASLECGEYGGGHGHPDRLHLTLHARGVHWLADPGTGSYVSSDLAWYRATLAHNAPRVDGVSQPMDDARCEMFDAPGAWGWARGVFGKLTRTLVAGPSHLVDFTEFADDQEHLVELPWHPAGSVEVVTPGQWVSDELAAPFVGNVERFLPTAPGPIVWRASAGDRVLQGIFDGNGEVLRGTCPPRPGEGGPARFLLRRMRGRYIRFAAVLAWDRPSLTGARFAPSEIVVETDVGTVTHRLTSDGWSVEEGSVLVTLRGARLVRRLLPIEVHRVGEEMLKYVPPVAVAHHLTVPPALDGSPAGFPAVESVHLDHDDQYRRTETPYPGQEQFSARASLGWDEHALYLAVEVTKPDPVFRAADAPPLRLDNDPDLVHADGVQVYLRLQDGPLVGWLVSPDPAGAGLQVRGVGSAAEAAQVRGGWSRTDDGYALTLAIAPPAWPPAPGDDPPQFELIVNEMRPGRTRRAGQLVWSGGGGWAYIRGDRPDGARFGRLELA